MTHHKNAIHICAYSFQLKKQNSFNTLLTASEVGRVLIVIVIKGFKKNAKSQNDLFQENFSTSTALLGHTHLTAICEW
jgi:hypothetical protein